MIDLSILFPIKEVIDWSDHRYLLGRLSVYKDEIAQCVSATDTMSMFIAWEVNWTCVELRCPGPDLGVISGQ